MKGFTLAEVLIVVTIIGILTAISIPLYVGQAEKARNATDLANLRAAKAEAIATITLGTLEDGTPLAASTDYWYNIETGKFQLAQLSSGYGKGTGKSSYYTSSNNDYGYNSKTDHRAGAIQMNFTYTTNGMKSVHICFKQYNKNYGQGGTPDEWSSTKIITM